VLGPKIARPRVEEGICGGVRKGDVI